MKHGVHLLITNNSKKNVTFLSEYSKTTICTPNISRKRLFCNIVILVFTIILN